MIASVKFTDHKVFRFFQSLFQPAVIAAAATLILYALVFWSVDKGVSIDEGYYLLGYLQDQSLGPSMTDFHRIVRTLFFFIPGENGLMFRWVQVVLTILFLVLFLRSSHGWIKKQYSITINQWLYYSMGMLAGTMCFAYASPVIYYDNIQLWIYLLAFSLFLFSQVISSALWKSLSLGGLGFILVFGLTNYPPSGAVLIFIMLMFLGMFALPSWKKLLAGWTFMLLGLAAGFFIYSIFIHDIRAFFREAFWAYANSAQAPKAKYDADGQWLVMSRYIKGMATVYLPVSGISIVYLLLAYKKLINPFILNIVFGLILLAVTYTYSVYFSNILLLPILLLSADAVIIIIGRKNRLQFSKNIFFILVLLALPLLAVAGSNQRLEMKMVYFMPFWFLAYFILVAEFKKYLDPSRTRVMHTVFITVFFIVFVNQGFLKHIHYNYSIKRSRHMIENAQRLTDIGVSDYQRYFYENGIRELEKVGFKAGDEVLAFYETFMLVYVAGGYVPHRLTYSAAFFVNNRENIPPEKTGFIIINEYQLPMMTEFLAGTDWGFPEGYTRTELGTDGQNLTQLGYKYILFAAK